MERQTIDFGIDLGTTNSAVAVLRGVSTEIIKSNRDADITPSVVGIDKRGAMRVGEDARGLAISDSGNAFSEFKRQMGANFQYIFERSGIAKRPEELSAEVLKELRGNVQQRTGESIDAAVITVPAAFELHQCDATRKAAELAGFVQSPLLQEPVAAALAYGFQTDSDRTFWLVYDFGGGTFDAAVIKSEEGTVRVVNHGGDNFLGGSDIDWALINGVIGPQLVSEYGMKEFSRGNPRWRVAFAKLKQSIERAKISLSRKESALIEDCSFQVEGGETIEVDFELSRSQVIAAAEPLIRRSVDICKQVLEEKKLSPSAIEKMILVGGPTLAPYFREQLQNSLGIALEHGVDPLTVVARGAAVFAGTQKRAVNKKTQDKTAFAIDLKHKPVGFDSAPLIGGRISAPDGSLLVGYSIEIVNEQSKWRSGKLAVSAEGVFTSTLRADRGTRNNYEIYLLDSKGERRRTAPDSFTYTIGSVVDEQPLINSMGVVTVDNEFDCLLQKGRGLPAKITKSYTTAAAMKKGQTGDVLKIPVCEGEALRGDRNRLIGLLVISGDKIPRNLPMHSEIEVTLEMDASRLMRVRAYVPILDADFETTLRMEVSPRAPSAVRSDLEAELQRIKDIKGKAKAVDDEDGVERLTSLERGSLVQELTRLARDVENPDAAVKCERRLIELKLAIDEVDDRLEWPSLIVKVQNLSERLVAEAAKAKDQSVRKPVEKICQELATLIQERRFDDLQAKLKQAESIYWRLVFATPEFWVYQFQYVEKNPGAFSDQARGGRLLEQGRSFIANNNTDGLQNVVVELWKLLPDETNAEFRRGYESGLKRGIGG